ncbi:MAG: PAS domain-containing protein, partial [Desulfobacterales bacterium]
MSKTTDNTGGPSARSNTTQLPDPYKIREQAREKARSITPPDLDSMTNEEIQQLFYEMQVKQIGGDLQAEQLRSQLEERDDQASLFSIVTENMLDMVALTDMEGTFTFAGKSNEILGYEPGYLIGKNVMDFVHLEDLPRILEEFGEFVASGHLRRVEYRYRCKDGTYILLETIGNFIKDENGIPKKIVFSSRDITERKRMEERLRESEERHRLLVESSNDIVWAFDLS